MLALSDTALERPHYQQQAQCGPRGAHFALIWSCLELLAQGNWGTRLRQEAQASSLYTLFYLQVRWLHTYLNACTPTQDK